MLKQHVKLTPKWALVCDVLITIASYFLAFPLRALCIKIYPFGGEVYVEDFPFLLPVIAGLWGLLFHFHGTDRPQRKASFSIEVKKIAKTVILGTLLLLALAFCFHVRNIPRTLIGTFFIINFVLLLLEKFAFLQVQDFLRKKGFNRRSVLIVGTGDIARKFVHSIREYADWGLDIVGFVDGHDKEIGSTFCDSKILGHPEEIADILHNNFIEEVIFALPSKNLEEAKDLMIQCEVEGVQTRIVSDFFSGFIAQAEADVVHGIPIITYSTVPRKEWQLLIKCLLDIIVSAVALIILSPLLLLIALAVKLSSPGPVFYKWRVVGLNKREFLSYKFRTMVENADELKEKLMSQNEMKGAVFKIKNDPRVTRVGRLLRKLSLDELPQLYSVLKGDMSLVGPRPPLVTEIDKFKNWQRRKLSVKPGMTCLWQVNGRNHIRDFDHWVKLDLEYIDNWSLWLDFKILLKTVPAVLSGKGAY